MEHRHQLHPHRAVTYITSGHGKATLVGLKTRYSYEFGTSRNGRLVFVRLLVAPDTYEYIGYINVVNNGGIVRMNKGRKGNPAHPAYVAMDWYLYHAVSRPEVAQQVEFWHEGVCGRCGRTLTVPLSIERGIGPKCHEAMTTTLAA